MDDRHDFGNESQGDVSSSAYAGAGTRIGLDVGTSKVVTAQGDSRDSQAAAQLNAFIGVAYTKLAEATLQQNRVPHFRQGEELVVYGSAAEKFAHMFNAECRRPMARGILNPQEPAATHVLESILCMLVPQAARKGETLAFSVPAGAGDMESELTYHEETLKQFLRGRGYTPIAVNEGLAVVLAELTNESFTGIGISCGGGMCNVALSYLSIPSLTFSITKGGDFIDSSVGQVVHEPATRIKAIKEDDLDLTRPSEDKIIKALQIYYDKLIQALVDELYRSVTRSQKLPRTDKPLPIVLAGGTAKPHGFRDRFEEMLLRRQMPFEVGEIRLADDPLTATARGTLVAALAER